MGMGPAENKSCAHNDRTIAVICQLITLILSVFIFLLQECIDPALFT